MRRVESTAGRTCGDPLHATFTGCCAAPEGEQARRSNNPRVRVREFTQVLPSGYCGTGETRTSTAAGLPFVTTGLDEVLMKRSWPSTSMRACTT